jgi:hypothetical protein
MDGNMLYYFRSGYLDRIKNEIENLKNKYGNENYQIQIRNG